MNVKKDDWRGLLQIICTAADRNFTEMQIISLVETMQTLGWTESCRIADFVSRSINIPRNVYGYVLNLLEAEIDRIRKAFLEKENWRAQNEHCASAEEFHLTMKCIGLISRLPDSANLLRRFGDYLAQADRDGTFLETLKKAIKFYSDLLESTTQTKES